MKGQPTHENQDAREQPPSQQYVEALIRYLRQSISAMRAVAALHPFLKITNTNL